MPSVPQTILPQHSWLRATRADLVGLAAARLHALAGLLLGASGILHRSLDCNSRGLENGKEENDGVVRAVAEINSRVAQSSVYPSM